MTNEDTANHMAALATKSAAAHDSGDAMRFSQAAGNLANALCALNSAPAPKTATESLKAHDEFVKTLVGKFLAWPLPKSVCSDLCTTNPNYKHSHSGTNLLSAHEARQMIEYLWGAA